MADDDQNVLFINWLNHHIRANLLQRRNCRDYPFSGENEMVNDAPGLFSMVNAASSCLERM